MSCYHNMTYYIFYMILPKRILYCCLLGQGPHPRSIHQLEHQQEGPFLGALGVHHPIRDEAPQRLDGEWGGPGVLTPRTWEIQQKRRFLVIQWGFYSDIYRGFIVTLMGFYSDLMFFFGDLLGFYGDLLGFYNDLMGFYSDIDGIL